ncbi:phospholipid scramblase 1 [Steccherinum ochraceum]|uniref:Phospholipid scramblase 1 n=1 Tax=Steccherinum ochraceum TaxID=92696 RepID=A0A4R0RS05_9APHY|nr:phospholipid scramblase 1 [Steccherinum ochraceum]
MVSKALMGCWAFVDAWLLAAGVLSLVMSLVWKAPNLLLNFTLTSSDLTAGTVLGVALLITFAFSLGAIVQRNHVTIGLVMLNWLLVVDALIVIVVGTYIWFFTLKERDNYFERFKAATPDVRVQLQNKFQCCGYFTTNDTVELTGFCANQTFVNTLVNANDLDQFRCVRPITAFADMTLNNIFSTVYGFMAIIILLFLASVCVINKRLEAERFKKIDAKRGGKGFV